jgi:hypothetical protein
VLTPHRVAGLELVGLSATPADVLAGLQSGSRRGKRGRPSCGRGGGHYRVVSRERTLEARSERVWFGSFGFVFFLLKSKTRLRQFFFDGER